MLAISACGSSGIKLSKPPPTTVAPTTSTTISTTADNGQEPAILAAYRGSLTDFNEVATSAPLNPTSAQLADHMSGDKLSSITASLQKLAGLGELDKGQLISLRASINQYNGTQAVVVSCERDTVEVINARTGLVVPNGQASNGTELDNDLVTLINGVWKVTQGNQVSPNCS